MRRIRALMQMLLKGGHARGQAHISRKTVELMTQTTWAQVPARFRQGLGVSVVIDNGARGEPGPG